jgi:hypothetical protein
VVFFVLAAAVLIAGEVVWVAFGGRIRGWMPPAAGMLLGTASGSLLLIGLRKLRSQRHMSTNDDSR